jgi:hypothetical protein
MDLAPQLSTIYVFNFFRFYMYGTYYAGYLMYIMYNLPMFSSFSCSSYFCWDALTNDDRQTFLGVTFTFRFRLSVDAYRIVTTSRVSAVHIDSSSKDLNCTAAEEEEVQRPSNNVQHGRILHA